MRIILTILILAAAGALSAAPPVGGAAVLTVQYSMQPTWSWGPQPVWEVPNGTTVAQLGLAMTVNHTQGTACRLDGPSSGSSTWVMAEWSSMGQFLPVPFNRQPITGTFDNDTHYLIGFSAQGQGGGLASAWAGHVIVGRPQAAAVQLTVNSAFGLVTQDAVFDVPKNTTVAQLGLSMTVTYGSPGTMCALVTHAVPLGSSPLTESQFSGSGMSPCTRPTASPSGVFSSAGSFQIRVIAGNGVMSTSTVLDFTVRVSEPSLQVRDGSASGPLIGYGSQPAGGRDFGSQDITTLPGGWSEIHVVNNGYLPVSVGVPALSGANAADFELDTAGMQSTLAGGAATSFAIRFNAQSVGAKQATVSFAHDAASAPSPFNFEIGGTALPPSAIIEVSDSSGVFANGAVAAGPREFGSVDIANMPSAPAVVTIRNTGTGALTLGTPSLSGDVQHFLLDTTSLALTVAPGASTTFSVALNSAAPGVRSASVIFSHDGANTGTPFIFGVRGIAVTGNTPLITTTTLPNGREGTPYIATFTAVNGFAPYSYSLAGGALPAGLTLQTTGELSGTPQIAGSFNFSVTVTDNYGGVDTKPFSLLVEPPLTLGSGAGGGGCSAKENPGVWYLAGLLLAALALARRRRLLQ